MSVTIEKHIGGVEYRFRTVTGTVEGVETLPDHGHWNSDGGGQVDLYHGGVEQTANTHLHTDHLREVRIDGDDGRVHTVTLSDYVAALPGDRVSLVYARPESVEGETLHGLRSHRETRWWSFNCKTLVRPELRNGVLGLMFRFWSGGVLSFAAAMVVTTLALMLAQLRPGVGIDPAALLIALPRGFQMMWMETLGWTAAMALAVRTLHGMEKRAAARSASETVLELALAAEDAQPADELEMRIAA